MTNGEQLELKDCPTGRDLVSGLLGERWTSPPKALVIEATDKDGRVIRIVIPFDESEMARVVVSASEVE